ncbi:MAG: DUF3999 domain-containing protein [Acidobacteriia bacterium]|nr:DUF3999 domain-containing protein [Terriglobia bacterium]
MKKPASSLLTGALCCALLLKADFQPSRWKYRRSLPAGATAQMVVLDVDRGTYINSQAGLADLRVVRGQDEVAYVLEKMHGSHQREEVSSRVLDQGVSSLGNLELTVEVGEGRRHNGVRLATPRTNFRQRVGIATSDDGRRWTRARDDGYIFDFSQDNRRVSVLYVSYPVSSRRYVRVTVYGWNNPKAVTNCWVTVEGNEAPAHDIMASLKAEPQQDTKTQSSVYTWNLGVARIPYDELSLEVGTPAFERAAVVETSRDGKDWSALGTGVLSRFPKEQSQKLDFPESREQYLRLRIYNRDDRPLAVKAATLSVIRTRVKFKPAGGGSYWLYYGNAEAHAPVYDLRDLLAREVPSPETTITAGLEERNPNYREKPPSPKPWSEQHPGILYITLALAVVGLGTVTVRFLRKAGAESPK